MVDCELCGRQTGEVYKIVVEEAELRVCAKCAKGKNAIAENSYEVTPKHHHVQMSQKEEEDIVEGYGNKIQKARERMKLPLKVLAEMINEKETLLLRIEQGKTRPNEELEKKLEKALGIKLKVGASEHEEFKYGAHKDEATIGEFIE